MYENRLPANYSFGTLTGAAAISDTTLTSTDFATQLASGLSTTNYVPITLQDPSTHNFEIVWVTAHTAAASTCTVVRGREATSARAWGSGTLWATAPTLRDGALWVTTRANLPTDPHVGMRCYIQDEQVTVERTLAQGWISYMPNGGPKANLRQTVTQSIPNNAFTTMTFDAEDFDNLSGHDTVTNNSRYTVPTGWGGKYILGGGACFEINATGARGCAWAKNGALINGSQMMIPSSGSLLTTLIPARSLEVQLAAGDYIELQVYQNSGAALNSAVSASAQSNFTIRYDGP